MPASTKNSGRKKNIAVFASGTGSNTVALHRFFRDNPLVDISLIASNNPDAGILTNAEVQDVSRWVFDRETLRDRKLFLATLQAHHVDLIVLAGFLWLIPAWLIEAYPGRILNIHPALLPSYGGKGMYGMNVHRTVFKAGEQESGMSIHYVNREYDRGEIIFQASVFIGDADSPEEVAARVLELEHYYYPRIVAQVANAI